MVCIEGEEYVKKNLTTFDKSEFLSIVGGYCTSGVMLQLRDLQKAFESDVKNRLHTLDPAEVVYLVKSFS